MCVSVTLWALTYYEWTHVWCFGTYTGLAPAKAGVRGLTPAGNSWSQLESLTDKSTAVWKSPCGKDSLATSINCVIATWTSLGVICVGGGGTSMISQ